MVPTLHRYFSTGRKFFATDGQIRDAVISKPFYYQGRPNQRKTFLSWLEESYASKEPVDLNRASIEHVMPQTLSPNWERALESDLGEWTSVDELHESLLHALANLTLTGYNSELSNRPFEEKRELLAESGLRMNADIASHLEWRRSDILERGQILADRITSTWTAPLADTEATDTGVSWKLVRDLVEAIPAGRWASYGDVATVAGTHPVPLGQYLATVWVPNAYRVLKRFGSISPGFNWSADSPHQGTEPIGLLKSEGVEFDDSGRASASQRMSVSELGELVGLTVRSDIELTEDEDGDREAFLANLADRYTPSTMHGVAELLGAWESLGGFLEYGTGDDPSCFLLYGSSATRPKTIWPLVVYPYGSVEVVFQHLANRAPFDDWELREGLRIRLNEARGVELGEGDLTKRPHFDIDVLADQQARKLILDALEWFVGELAAYEFELVGP